MSKNKKSEEREEPIVLMGDTAFTLSELLDMDNKPEVKAKVEEWVAKKEKAFERAEKRRNRYKRR